MKHSSIQSLKTAGILLAAASSTLLAQSYPQPQRLADVNGDGAVDAADFSAWTNAFNNNLPMADQNMDGMIDPTDFSAWVSNFNLAEKGPSAAFQSIDLNSYGTNGANVIYVSEANGDDGNGHDGSELLPFETIQKAFDVAKNLPTGEPRAVLLERDGTYGVQQGEGWGWMQPSLDGDFAVLGAYGSGDRPILKPEASNKPIVAPNGNSKHDGMSNALFSQLVFRPYSETLGQGLFKGFAFKVNREIDNLWLEDVDIQYFEEGIRVVPDVGDKARNIQILRSVISNNGNPAPVNGNYVDGDPWGDRASGIYTSKTEGINIEHSVVWRNGWTSWHPAVQATLPAADADRDPSDERYNASQFSHGIYIQYNCDDLPADGLPITLRYNFIGNNASHGAQVRPGGVVEENVFWKNAIGLQIGSQEATGDGDYDIDDLAKATIRDNLFLEMQDLSQQPTYSGHSTALGRGIALGTVNQTSVVEDNIFAHIGGRQSRAIHHEVPEHSDHLTTHASVTYEDNRIFESEWQFMLVEPISDGSVLYQNNTYSTHNEGTGTPYLAGPLLGFWAGDDVQNVAGNPKSQTNLLNLTLSNNINTILGVSDPYPPLLTDLSAYTNIVSDLNAGGYVSGSNALTAYKQQLP